MASITQLENLHTGSEILWHIVYRENFLENFLANFKVSLIVTRVSTRLPSAFCHLLYTKTLDTLHDVVSFSSSSDSLSQPEEALPHLADIPWQPKNCNPRVTKLKCNCLERRKSAEAGFSTAGIVFLWRGLIAVKEPRGVSLI